MISAYVGGERKERTLLSAASGILSKSGEMELSRECFLYWEPDYLTTVSTPEHISRYFSQYVGQEVTMEIDGKLQNGSVEKVEVKEGDAVMRFRREGMGQVEVVKLSSEMKDQVSIPSPHYLMRQKVEAVRLGR